MTAPLANCDITPYDSFIIACSSRMIYLMGSTKAFGVTRVDPVCRLINDPQEAFWIYEGLQQYHGMPKNLLPITIRAPLAQGQNA
jgi:hypothetical protein